MSKIKFFFVYWVWQFPQMLIGKFIAKRWKKVFKENLTVEEKDLINIMETNYKCKLYVVKADAKETHWFWKFISGMSLGYRISLTDIHDEEIIKHEMGHSIISLIFGLFYLLFNGFPSALGNLYGRTLKAWTRYEKSYRYYIKQPWEWWADYFGKVDRNIVLAMIPYENSTRYPKQENQVI